MTYGSLDLVDRNWVISDLDPHVAIKLKRWFPRVNPSAGMLMITASPENSFELRWFCERYPLKVSDEDRKKLVRGAKTHEANTKSVNHLLTGRRRSDAIELAIPARAYQLLASELCYTTGSLLCADEVGGGKTCTAISLFAREGCMPAAVVCPLGLLNQWQEMLARFLPSAKSHIIRVAPPADVAATKSKAGSITYDNADVVIMPYSRLPQWSSILHPNTVVFDEAHELRNQGTNKYLAALELCAGAQWRMGLSATPIFNRGDEFFNVLGVLAPDSLGTKEEFVREWCGVTDMRGRSSIRDPPAFGAWVRERGLMIRRSRTDMGRELPPIVRSIINVDVNKRHVEATAPKNAMTDLAWRSLYSAPKQSFAARGELNMQMRQWTGVAKAWACAAFVAELVEATDEPVILAGWHYEVYDSWLKYLKTQPGLNPVMYTGRENEKEKLASLAAFTSGKSKVLIMSLRAGQGIDGLQGICHRVVYGELDWSPTPHIQFTGRVHRDGQQQTTMEYWLVCDEGSDPIVLDTLGVKRWQSDGVIDPHGERALSVKIDPDHMKKLAEDFLRKQGLDPSKPPKNWVVEVDRSAT